MCYFLLQDDADQVLKQQEELIKPSDLEKLKRKMQKKPKKLPSVCAAEHPHKSSLIPHDVVFI